MLKIVHRSCLLIIPCILFTSQLWATPASGLVKQKDLRSLLLSPKDFPLDVISSIEEGQSTHKALPPAGGDMSSCWFTQNLSGPPSRWLDYTPGYGVSLEVCIMPSAAAAGKAIERMVKSMSVILPESRSKLLHSFADRAWNRGNMIRFSRRNVAVTIHTHDSELDTRKLTLKFAKQIGQKIDAAAAGKPGQTPEFPKTKPQDTYTNWSIPLINKMLQSPAKNTIILKCGDRPPVTMRADGLPGKDLTVRLQPLTVTISHKRFLNISERQAKAILDGKHIIFAANSPIVQVNGKPIHLSRPVVFRTGQNVLIPLSFVERVLGKHITWKKSGKIMVGSM